MVIVDLKPLFAMVGTGSGKTTGGKGSKKAKGKEVKEVGKEGGDSSNGGKRSETIAVASQETCGGKNTCGEKNTGTVFKV